MFNNIIILKILDIEDGEWEIKSEDMEKISPEELENEINSMLS